MFDPFDWHWIVGGDDTRAWSSAAGAYVQSWPSDMVTRIASETELSDVLRKYGLDVPGLDDMKRDYKERIDNDAEAARMKFLTPGSGMAMTYQEKFAQAQGIMAMGETAANAMTESERNAQFPTLSASVGIEGDTIWECSQLVLTKYAQFAQLSRMIEKSRLTGKAAVGAASNAADVRAAYEAVTWPTP
jgi:hypothetical protein